MGFFLGPTNFFLDQPWIRLPSVTKASSGLRFLYSETWWFKIRRLVSRVSRIRRWLEIHPCFFGWGTYRHSHNIEMGLVYLPLFTYIWWILMVNVGKYTIHGRYGIILVKLYDKSIWLAEL